MNKKTNTIDAKHIFIDIVSYTHNRSVEAQTDLIEYLNEIVKTTLKEKQIKSHQRIFIPTGDGMCISLIKVIEPYDIHLEIALSILEKIDIRNQKEKDEMRRFNIRIGINENIDNLIIDINGRKNVSGSGINNASRIEGLADVGQILIGNSVHEKLVQREKYMKSFSSYTSEVKHGLILKVHQYKNEKLTYLNSGIPNRFKPKQQKIFRLTEIQAYYISCCIKLEDLISKKIAHGQSRYSLQVLLFQLAEDHLAKSKVTKINPDPTVKVKRSVEDHFQYIQSVDFWIITDLSSFYANEYLYNASFLFEETYLFVNDKGKVQLKEDFPEIFKKFGLK